MRQGCVGPDPSCVLICFSAVRRLCCGVVTGTKQLLVAPRLTAKTSQGLILFTNLLKTDKAASPKSTLSLPTPTTSLSWVMMPWVCAETWHSSTLHIKWPLQGPHTGARWLALFAATAWLHTYFQPCVRAFRKFGPRQQKCSGKRSRAQTSLGTVWVLSKPQVTGLAQTCCAGRNMVTGLAQTSLASLVTAQHWC